MGPGSLRKNLLDLAPWRELAKVEVIALLTFLFEYAKLHQTCVYFAAYAET